MKQTIRTWRLKRENGKKREKNIRNQLYELMLIVMLPMLVTIVALLGFLFAINTQYDHALQNLSVAAEFNAKFKPNLDGAMWKYAISTREGALPLEEVEQAEQLLKKLKQNTTQTNQWRIRSMENMCKNLREYMQEIAETDSYDARTQMMDTKIYPITTLLNSYMLDYTYDEVQEMARLKVQINEKVTIATVVVTVFVVWLLLVVMVAVVRFTRRLTDPIQILCDKVRTVGHGDFSVEPVETDCTEVKVLDEGFDEMVGQLDDMISHRMEDQKTLHRAQLELLQAQINPHFLYNTLDSIVWLAETHKEKEVIHMVSSLSVFFRTSLSKGKDVISIEEEIKHVRSYLEIQKIRYQDILNYKIEVDAPMMHYTIPKLVLQPLVENAIYHGIKHRRGGGKITIRGYETEQTIWLLVQDDGVGLSREALQTLRDSVYHGDASGVGLANVQKRLELYFGEGHGLYFDSVEGIGTMVSVKMPKKIQATS